MTNYFRIQKKNCKRTYVRLVIIVLNNVIACRESISIKERDIKGSWVIPGGNVALYFLMRDADEAAKEK